MFIADHPTDIMIDFEERLGALNALAFLVISNHANLSEVLDLQLAHGIRALSDDWSETQEALNAAWAARQEKAQVAP